MFFILKYYYMIIIMIIKIFFKNRLISLNIIKKYKCFVQNLLFYRIIKTNSKYKTRHCEKTVGFRGNLLLFLRHCENF